MAYAEKRVSTAKGSRGRVSWRSRYKRPDGTWGSEPGFPTKKTAERWGEAQEEGIQTGRWVDPELMRKHFGAWAREWMAAQTPRGRTTVNRWYLLDTHILPKWEYTPLVAFNWFDVEAWARTLPCYPSTTRKTVQTMSQILTGAVDARHLTVNPLYGRRLTGLTMPESRKPARSESSYGDADGGIIATPEEVLLLARRLGPVVGLQVLVIAFTGVRFEELAGLRGHNALLIRRQKYDGGFFECPVIRIDQKFGAFVQYNVRDEEGKRRCFRGLEPPKNEQSARDIDIPSFLEKLLRQHLDGWPHEHVFTTPTGILWWRSHWCGLLRPAADGRDARPNARGRAVKEVWEPIKPGLTARDLRKTHDSWQEEIGVQPVLGYEQMGHKYPGIKGTYRRPTPAMRKHRLEGLQRLFERALTNLGWGRVWEE
ncbi:hypothetical protein [Streptomyces syringium]|uniref:hypothetical protein n=1 Tax=Streptomyces syringium TaxID=76729 RepID=UPI0037D8206E